MNKFWLVFLIVLCLVPSMSLAAEEKVLDLPKDEATWYISVIGNKDQVEQLTKLFDESPLDGLKSQVHFLPITTDSAMFAERYATNQGAFEIKSYPAVRVQTAEGIVVYQGEGDALSSSSAIYASISAGCHREAIKRLLFPWRRHHVTPAPAPIHVGPVVVAPLPALANGDPLLDEEINPLLVAVASILAGIAVGLVVAQVQAIKAKAK